MRSQPLLLLLVVLALLTTACGSDEQDGANDSVGASDAASNDIPDTRAETDLSERNLIAGVNIAIADVDLGQVVFDTFDGGSIALSEASESQILGLLNAIPPIDDPVYTSGVDADWLTGDDLVLGFVAADGTAWAHPHRILNFHEIVNTEFAGEPVAITYCPLCGSGLVFDRRINDLRHEGVLTFDNTSALYENDMVMVDEETNTYWWQVGGRGIVGNLTGTSLQLLPSMTTTWASWLELYPNTMVLSDDQGRDRPYDSDPFQNYGTRLDAGQTPFPTSPEAFADERLAPSTRVIGFEVNGTPAAVAVLANQPTVVAINADQVVFLDGRGGGGLFSTLVDGSPASFEADADSGGFVDDVTRSTWNAAGVATNGPAVGQSLTALPSSTAYWFAWVSTLDGATTELFAPTSGA